MINITTSECLALREKEQSMPQNLRETVEAIAERVKSAGDLALREYTHQFDGIRLESLKLPLSRRNELAAECAEDVRRAIDTAYANIERFHTPQKPENYSVDVVDGVKCAMRYLPIKRVGFYIPAGTAVLFSSLLMTAIPSNIAKNPMQILCTPPNKNGEIAPELAYTAKICGIENIFLLGGAQAIMAMALGTASVPKVDKIVGPGNAYVTAAKQYVSQATRTAIDMPAGPSEVMIIADEAANAEFVVQDLLSQAEHGADSLAVLVSTSAQLISKVKAKIPREIAAHPRRALLEESCKLMQFVQVNSIADAIDLANNFASEHLILNTKSFEKDAENIWAAGSVFCSAYAAESFGDYASGTNHTLPTMGFANAYSGLGVRDFMRSMSLQTITAQGVKKLGKTVEIMAEAEGLYSHKKAVSLRLAALGDEQ
jgi:histidinol dehydrogenase